MSNIIKDSDINGTNYEENCGKRNNDENVMKMIIIIIMLIKHISNDNGCDKNGKMITIIILVIILLFHFVGIIININISIMRKNI